MLGLDRRAAQVTWTVFLIVVCLLALYIVRDTLMILVLALFFAYMLWPAVEFVRRFAPHRLSPNAALAAVYVLLVAILVTLGTLLGSLIAAQATSLANRFPEYIQKSSALAAAPLPGWIGPIREKTLDVLRSQAANLDREIVPILRKAGEGILTGLGTLLSVVLIPILSFFFLKDGPRIRDAILSYTTEGRPRALMEGIIADVHILLGQYIRALVILAAATFAAYSLFFGAAGVPYAVLLAGMAAVLEFIPMFGPLTASIVILLTSGFTGYLTVTNSAGATSLALGHLLALLIFLTVYRLFQDYVLNPFLMSEGVEIHPLLVLFGVLAGEQLAGVPGMFFSVPVIATLRVIFLRVRRQPVVVQDLGS